MRLPMNDALARLQLSGIRRFTAMAKKTPGCVQLTLGEPEFDTPEPVKAETVRSLARNETHYPPNNGQPYLLEALSEAASRRGLRYAPGEIILTCGATEALFSTFAALLNPGDEVIVPTPAFSLYESAVTMLRGAPVPLDTARGGFQLTEEGLRAALSPRTKAIVLNSPNNPTGCVYNERTLSLVADIAGETGLYVVCDDVYHALTYDGGTPGFAARYPALREQIIVVDSFSKPYAMTGWRLGWVMADAPVKAQIEKAHQYAVSSAASFPQRACAAALSLDVSPVRERYRRRRDLVCDRLTELGLSVTKPDGAFYIFPSIAKFGMGAEEFCTRLIREGGLALVPGTCFGAEGYARLSYCYSEAELEEGLNRLAAFLERL